MLCRMTARPAALRSRPGLRLQALVVLAVVASLLLAGCGGGGKSADKKASDRPSSQPTSGGTQLAAVWPLTGLPAPATTPTHPVMIVKIDNSAASDPQYGLGKADMVAEELVEGGITRLAAMFYSQLPQKAGPVRSARASDIGVVTPLHAALVASGMAPPTVARLNAAKVRYYTMGAPGVVRAPDGKHDTLHSVFADLPKLARTLKKNAVVPASYLPWGQETDFAGGQPATRMAVTFSRATTTNWVYDAQTKKYTNTNSYAAAGDEFKPDSVLVLRVREGDAGYRDPAGNPVPEALFFGKGQMLLFHGGQVTRGTWSKTARDSALVLNTAAGPMKVPAGHVWLELTPNKKAGGSVSFR